MKNITLGFFEVLAKKCSNSEEFITKVRGIKNVPLAVSKEFYQKYSNNGELAPEKTAEIFYTKFQIKQ